MAPRQETLSHGTLKFSVEGRLLRELGERLVKQPEVALIELIKNAYDADAPSCDVIYRVDSDVTITDTGHGMTLDEFRRGWMTIGSSAKAAEPTTREYGRNVTGEKGIGRFAVRFLGTRLALTSIAYDPDRRVRTRLTADFDWPAFDREDDLANVKVPYTLVEAEPTDAIGTVLHITQLRAPAALVKLKTVRNAVLSVVSPYGALLPENDGSAESPKRRRGRTADPGFSVTIQPADESAGDPSAHGNIAATVLANAVLRAHLTLRGDRLDLRVYRRSEKRPLLRVNERYVHMIGDVTADIRFLPVREGSFAGLPVDGRIARAWAKEHGGVAVFDRAFRVLPYGTEADDWLQLDADHAKRLREPRSTLAKKHLTMSDAERTSTTTNYMLRLPYANQLIGVVQVAGVRGVHATKREHGLVAAADRQGFVANAAFAQLFDVIRGAVEAIAAIDRKLQLEQEALDYKTTLRKLRAETRAAVREINANPRIRADVKKRLVQHLVGAQAAADETAQRARDREERLEVMGLLGIVAGFMTHEFGVALDELERGKKKIATLATRDPALREVVKALDVHLVSLREFVLYSQGYIRGASAVPERVYSARPRIQQAIRIFGKYATDRDIAIVLDVVNTVDAPRVPVALYNGVVLNLYSNALKAVMSRAGHDVRQIAFRAWNDKTFHTLEVSDTGIGIPSALRNRVFEPLFTTTEGNQDLLGSGMGLGLSLVRKGVESFGGTVEIVDPPAGFATCVRVRLPLENKK